MSKRCLQHVSGPLHRKKSHVQSAENTFKKLALEISRKSFKHQKVVIGHWPSKQIFYTVVLDKIWFTSIWDFRHFPHLPSFTCPSKIAYYEDQHKVNKT